MIDRRRKTTWRALQSKPNIIYCAFVVFLCIISYFLGIFLHSRGDAPRRPTSTITSIHCNSHLHSNHYIYTSSPPLDFAEHHSADGLVKPNSKLIFFPTCDASYSEYTPCQDQPRSMRFPFDFDGCIRWERHCPMKTELFKCLIPAPSGYRTPFPWPESRNIAWFANIPLKTLAVPKASQNWVQVIGDKFRFPGADAYVDDIARLVPLNDGSIRTAVDTGCGVASFGAYMMSRNITTMSFAPRDSHEAQVQFALERGVPAMIGVIASVRLPYPSRAFDLAHCSRCLVPWHLYGGKYLAEVDRILRPGGYWVLSGPPINWKEIEGVADKLCWEKVEEKSEVAVWKKPINHIQCEDGRKTIRFCSRDQNPDEAWYTKLQTCITRLPEVKSIEDTAGGRLTKWPERLTAIPPRIQQSGGSESFLEDSEVWRKRVGRYKLLIGGLQTGGKFRNILDMNSNLGGFAASLALDPVWVMNMVPTRPSGVDTLGVIYERGLIGTYQDWCEAMSTYPRTYDFIHADSVFSIYENRCDMEDILLEMDRILRPDGSVIFRDDVDVLVKIKSITDGMRWDTIFVDHEDGPRCREKLLVAVKKDWTID